NVGWTWHLEDLTFAEATIELCDGRPSDVEREGNRFGGGTFCPWSAAVVRIDEREESRAAPGWDAARECLCENLRRDYGRRDQSAAGAAAASFSRSRYCVFSIVTPTNLIVPPWNVPGVRYSSLTASPLSRPMHKPSPDSVNLPTCALMSPCATALSLT